jgi:hypothetical protein
MDQPITVRSVATGAETIAPAALWLQCLLEMLPPQQLGELVRRVESICGAGLVQPPAPRHYHMTAEPGHYGLRGRPIGG